MTKKIFILIFAIAIFFPFLAFGFDYTESCQKTGGVNCKPGTECVFPGQCQFSNCAFSCPSPAPNSYLSGNNCQKDEDFNCTCSSFCGGSADCYITGNCEYTCDENYEWTGEECEELPPSEVFLLDVFFTYFFIVGSHLLPIFAYFLLVVLVISLIKKFLTTI